MTDDIEETATDLTTAEDRELASNDANEVAIDVVPDEQNDTVTFIVADAQNRMGAWITAESDDVVHVTEMQ